MKIFSETIKTSNSSIAMTEQHPSISAVGSHFDEAVEIAALAQKYYEQEGRPEGRSLEHWLRAEQELHQRTMTPARKVSTKPPAEADMRTEEMMHLDQ